MTPMNRFVGKAVWAMCVAFVLASVSIARAQSPADVAALLPADGVTLDVMEPVMPKRLEELAIRVQAALVKDPAWSQAFISRAKPGESLPFDEKLGLTRAEYDEFLALSREARLGKVGTATLRVERKGDIAVLLFGERFRGMERIEINLAQGSASTPSGTLATLQRIVANAQQAATGPWDGVQWMTNIAGGDPARPGVTLALGRLQATGRGIFYYNVRPAMSNPAAAARYVLYYDLAQPTP